jgi:hypothetical protein
MAESSLAKKLAIKPRNTVRVIDAPQGYEHLLGDLPEGARELDNGDGQADVVLVFGESRATLERTLPTAITKVHPGGVFWAAYPKGGKSDLSREIMWKLFEPYLWRPVSQIAIDDTWSALRFRPAADVTSKKSES